MLFLGFQLTGPPIDPPQVLDLAEASAGDGTGTASVEAGSSSATGWRKWFAAEKTEPLRRGIWRQLETWGIV